MWQCFVTYPFAEKYDFRLVLKLQGLQQVLNTHAVRIIDALKNLYGSSIDENS